MFNFKVDSKANGGTDCVLVSDDMKYTVRFSVKRAGWVRAMALPQED